MSGSEFVIALVNGVSFGFLLFLTAIGLSLVFGVMGILNLAHGAFFMLGAFLAYEIGGAAALHPAMFVLVMIAAGILTAAIAAGIEITLFRRVYDREHLEILVFAFSLLFVAEGAVRLQWGVNPILVSHPEGLGGSIEVLGATVPQYSLFLIGVGAAVLAILAYVLTRTRAGYIMRAVASDEWMARALGINVGLVFTGVFALGAFLAAMGGALVGPNQALTPQLGLTFLVSAFAVVIVGGLDSIAGTLIASILLGLLNSFLVVGLPELAPYSFFLGLIVVLLVRPQGLLGSRELLRRMT